MESEGTGWKATLFHWPETQFPSHAPAGTCATLQIHTCRTGMCKAESEKRFRVLLYKLKGSSKHCKLVLGFPLWQQTQQPTPTPALSWNTMLERRSHFCTSRQIPTIPFQKAEINCFNTVRAGFCLFVFFPPPAQKTFLCNDLDCWKPVHFHGAHSADPVSLKKALPILPQPLSTLLVPLFS